MKSHWPQAIAHPPDRWRWASNTRVSVYGVHAMSGVHALPHTGMCGVHATHGCLYGAYAVPHTGMCGVHAMSR